MSREMKDSGVAWIGEIPASWNYGRIKYNYYLKGRIGWQGLKADEFTEEGPFLVTGTDFTNGTVNWDTCYHISEERFAEDPDIHVNVGDLLITKDGTVGKVAYIDNKPEKVSLNSHLLIMRPISPKYNNRFLFWVIQSYVFERFFQLSQNGTIMASLSQERINGFSFALPSIQKQNDIVNYLDDKCAKIDAIIARQQEIIEKLKEYKLSVITEAVTRGLYPDVPMKDSGVEWIGEIPAHWQLIRLKFLMSLIVDCPHETPIYSNDGQYLVIRTADQDYGFLRSEDDMYRLDESEYIQRIRRLPLNKDDIVYGREGERWGLACLVPESNKYCLGQRMMQFRCKTEMIIPMFAMWALNSKNVYLQGSVDTFGSTSPHVNISTMINYYIPVPPIKEQASILEQITVKTSAIDSSIAQRERAINKLTEYKKSLIYECVTGKREVS